MSENSSLGRMSSNTSQRKAQTLILTASVADYRDWTLIADCGACGPRRLSMDGLPTVSMMRVILRLRCLRCGGRVTTAAIENALPGWQHRIVRIWGAGSYG